jgi:hypothetical protein
MKAVPVTFGITFSSERAVVRAHRPVEPRHARPEGHR